MHINFSYGWNLICAIPCAMLPFQENALHLPSFLLLRKALMRITSLQSLFFILLSIFSSSLPLQKVNDILNCNAVSTTMVRIQWLQQINNYLSNTCSKYTDFGDTFSMSWICFHRWPTLFCLEWYRGEEVWSFPFHHSPVSTLLLTWTSIQLPKWVSISGEEAPPD